MDYISVITKEEELKDKIVNSFDNSIIDTDDNFIKLRNEKTVTYKLAKIIGEMFEKKLILTLIDKNFSDFTRTEKLEIYKIISNEEKDRVIHLRFLIENELNRFFENEKELNIDGFLIFRLNEYKLFLNKIIEDSVEKYIVDKEFYYFIDLIKVYLSTQKPLIDIIHVYKYKNTFRLYDKNGNDITNKYILEFDDNIMFTDLTEDDELLSILIGISPKQIFLHNENEFKNKIFIETLKKIFETKIYCCN